jgi:ribosomal protein S18 acetylase RimI-like enzyme
VSASPNRDIDQHGISVGRVIVALTPDGKTLHLLDIAITATARNRGIGTAMIGALADAAMGIGVVHMTLAVLASNLSARRLYERLGFVVTGGDTHLLMEKPLVDSVRVAAAARWPDRLRLSPA